MSLDQPWKPGDPLLCSCGEPECQEATRQLGLRVADYLIALLVVRAKNPRLSEAQQHAITQRIIGGRDHET